MSTNKNRWGTTLYPSPIQNTPKPYQIVLILPPKPHEGHDEQHKSYIPFKSRVYLGISPGVASNKNNKTSLCLILSGRKMLNDLLKIYCIHVLICLNYLNMQIRVDLVKYTKIIYNISLWRIILKLNRYKYYKADYDKRSMLLQKTESEHYRFWRIGDHGTNWVAMVDTWFDRRLVHFFQIRMYRQRATDQLDNHLDGGVVGVDKSLQTFNRQ